ncbi:uncharacterized protein TEOVI_000571500 [Trypanosoma equiperdum]|uniref:SpoU rRNA Methylase family n=1 Tax=Trypanosoma equiperdum TaxID=5694 RepID=A0A1G4I218_TRYEQ|nr:hypothetical protein, conserved [Trypanosoma equiperdum]
MFFNQLLLRLRVTPRRFPQASAPPRKVCTDNPLTRWSQMLRLGWPKHCHLPHLSVGLEGCTSAFNAMNSIRTCMFYGTAVPPSFLSLSKAEDIKNIRDRQCGTDDAGSNPETTSLVLNRVAQFGKEAFFRGQWAENFPLVALENFTHRSQSLFTCRISSVARLLIGHENRGVSSKYIECDNATISDESDGQCADCVVYVPQYGTISSLNVVTSMGIALFYAFLDQNFPHSRSLMTETTKRAFCPNTDDELEALLSYQRCFRERIPTTHGYGVPSRIDPRPIHPLYFGKNVENIIDTHNHLRKLLLRACSDQRRPGKGRCFGLSVLCQNEIDLRNLGGIVRSANAFLVDNIFYFGRRKINVVGTVGTQHYTPPTYLGDLYEGCGSSIEDMEPQLNLMKKRLDEANVPCRWWFLDCGHKFLYSASRSRVSDLQDLQGSEGSQAALEAVKWYETRYSDPNCMLSLCESEETLREAIREGVLLVVPQEGILPPLHILQRCEKILTVLPHDFTDTVSAGLPVAVAAGIALQRLSAVMHPNITTL